jgi:hypothetical protein
MVDEGSSESSGETRTDDATDGAIRVTCSDCHFERRVGADDDRSPAEIVIEHGRENGHTLRIVRSK